jgi:hypothetical protein
MADPAARLAGRAFVLILETVPSITCSASPVSPLRMLKQASRRARGL